MSTSRDGRALAKRHVWLTSAIIAASIGLLPRITSSASVQVYSVDRPEHPLLTPITSGPVNATSWNLIGTLMGLLVLAVSQEGWSLRRLLDATIAHAISTACIFPIIVCFGGPLNMSTAILSAQIGALTIFPAIYILGLPSLDSNGVAARYRLTRLLCEFSPQSTTERLIVRSAVGTIVGAWIGGLALALDWDRPWQTYPLTPTIGASAGFICGALSV
ncbi:GPI biosynthesis protein family Pig-F-domain-containing protein [Papiliotrema laurentii]|uniref:GPI biosynthesis protein family Pig-F-domain-containing protein n=1 Tax=Papiliotrema laurentii TaxID=5418 RepID=A0AAD9CW66_PAPLA|nr:GPI biosynthesis protein family Pig-F-domain-containing protein [Papiliotrema laurentii]